MSYAALKRRNKEVFVDLAFSIFSSKAQVESDLKTQWVEYLLESNNADFFIQELKQGRIDALTLTGVEADRSTAQDSIGEVRVIDENLDFHAGLKRKLRIKVRNNQEDTFQTTPEEPLFASYHWHHFDNEVYEYDGVRTPLESSISQGQELEMTLSITPPAEPGDYKLMVTMVYEGRYWMEEVGLNVQAIPITVQDYDGRGLTRHGLSVYKQLQAAELERSF